jgi:hypothetical protein
MSKSDIRDGDPNLESNVTLFKVFRTIKKGEVDPREQLMLLLFFSSRDGVRGSTSQSTFFPSKRPKTSPGNRGGKGKGK